MQLLSRWPRSSEVYNGCKEEGFVWNNLEWIEGLAGRGNKRTRRTVSDCLFILSLLYLFSNESNEMEFLHLYLFLLQIPFTCLGKGLAHLSLFLPSIICRPWHTSLVLSNPHRHILALFWFYLSASSASYFFKICLPTISPPTMTSPLGSNSSRILTHNTLRSTHGANHLPNSICLFHPNHSHPHRSSAPAQSRSRMQNSSPDAQHRPQNSGSSPSHVLTLFLNLRAGRDS